MMPHRKGGDNFMRKESNSNITIYNLSSIEWQQLTQLNTNPESMGIRISLMNDNSYKVIIDTSNSYKVMWFEAMTSAAQIKIDNNP
jgi:hypothetical protein